MPRKKRPKYGLNKHHTHKYARDFLDYDYIDSLPPDALAFLDKFSQEYYQDTFRNGRTDFHRRGSQERRDCYNRQNARRRDMWNQWHRVAVSPDALEVDESGKAHLPERDDTPEDDDK